MISTTIEHGNRLLLSRVVKNTIIRNYTSNVSGNWEMCELIGIVFEVP